MCERETVCVCERKRQEPLGERSRKTPMPHELGSVAELSVRRERVRGRVRVRESLCVCVCGREREREFV